MTTGEPNELDNDGGGTLGYESPTTAALAPGVPYGAGGVFLNEALLAGVVRCVAPLA